MRNQQLTVMSDRLRVQLCLALQCPCWGTRCAQHREDIALVHSCVPICSRTSHPLQESHQPPDSLSFDRPLGPCAPLIHPHPCQISRSRVVVNCVLVCARGACGVGVRVYLRACVRAHQVRWWRPRKHSKFTSRAREIVAAVVLVGFRMRRSSPDMALPNELWEMIISLLSVCPVSTRPRLLSCTHPAVGLLAH